MIQELRLLTFDRYETYLAPLTRAAHRWDVIAGDRATRHQPWEAARIYSSRARVIGEPEARKRLDRGDYDVVLCHGPRDLAVVAGTGIPTICLFHGTRELETVGGFEREGVSERFGNAFERSHRVFAGPGLRESWGIEGDVIPPSIDADAYGPYEGDLPAALAVGDFETTRALLAGAPAVGRLLAGLPVTLMGINPPLAVERPSTAARLDAYRRHQVFVSTAREPYDAGCPFALAEAMATGMPIVTLAHGATPIVDGRTGLVAGTADQLRERVLALLEDRQLATALGRAARADAQARFSPAAFLTRWDRLLRDAAAGSTHDATRTGLHEAAR